MTDLRQAAQQALEALQNCANGEDDVLLTRDALADLRAALKQQAEPVMLNGLTEAETNAAASVLGLTKQAEPVVFEVAYAHDGKLFLNGRQIGPGTIDVKADGLTYRSSEKVEVRQQAERWCMKANGCKTECGNCPNFTRPEQQAELKLSSEEIQQVLAAASVPEGLRTPEMEDCLQRCRDRATGTIKIQEWEDAKTASMVPVIPAESITDAMMNLVDRLGSEWKQVDLRAWQHLFVYAPQRKPLTDEQDRALCEAYCNDASDEYFKARPALDFPAMRRIFYAGHRKAWISYEAAHSIKEANNAN